MTGALAWQVIHNKKKHVFVLREDRTGIARGLPSLVCFPLALYFSPFVSATSTDGTPSLVIAFDLIELATCKGTLPIF